jgi:putative nucleotidyltransferase with HDIG domain
MQELDEYINSVKELPPAPRVLAKLLASLSKPDSDTAEVVQLITYDPSLTATVLKLCNSAYFASSTAASDLNEAVQRIGFNNIYRIVASVSGSRLLGPPQQGYGFAAGELWKHSVAAGIAAQCVAEEAGDDPNTAFTAGLLHDLGKIVLAGALTDQYTKLVSETEARQHSLLEAEKTILGVQHAEIGGRLLAKWQFPDDLVAGVWHHHQPSGAENHNRLAACVYLGNMIAHFMGYSYGHQAFAFRGRGEALEILNLSPDQLPPYMIQTFDRLEEVEALFHPNS